jgi:hypothetical protein
MAVTQKSGTGERRSAAVELSAILLVGLKALADAGEAERACRLAGQACMVLRREHADEWRRFNALLHRLAIRTGPVDIPTASAQLTR